MGSKVGKLAERETAEGTIQSYIHANGKVGVLVQVECNTDFVARNDDFIAFAKDIALHIAAANPLYTSVQDIPAEEIESEKRVYEGQLGDVPEQAREKALEGKLRKWYEEVVLLEQPHVNGDKHDGKSIEQLRSDLSAKTGENVVIGRFDRFSIG
jgi:elongation factor Ts